MPIKIWNRPKVEFGDKIAYCMGFEIAIIHDTLNFHHAAISAYGMRSYKKSGAIRQISWDDDQTFEQAVNEWVENYVKQNFQPIVLPGKGCGISSDFDFGWEASTKDLLKLNPNIIIEEVQGE